MVIAIQTQEATRLPIRDALLSVPTSRSSKISIQPGAVYYSGLMDPAPIGMAQLYEVGSADAMRFTALQS